MIIIAWIALDGAEQTDELEQFDGVNIRYKWRTVAKAHALVYSSNLTDLDKAVKYANSDDCKANRELVRVYTFDDSVPEPLDVARKAVLAEYNGTIKVS